MSEGLTPRQQILLWDLVSRGGSALQKDFKPEIERADREILEQAKLIAVTRSRGFTLVMTDMGWDHIARSAPKLDGTGSKYDRPILQFVLSRVQDYASRNEIVFANLFATQAQPPVDGSMQPVKTHTAMESAIQAAFFDIAGRPASGNIRLSQLRSHLPDFAREDVDKTLTAMWQAGKANLMNLDNPRDIEAERDAALKIGSNTFHVLRISE